MILSLSLDLPDDGPISPPPASSDVGSSNT